MKNKNITEKIINEYTAIAETPNGEIWKKIENRINKTDIAAHNKKNNKSILKPILVTAILVVFVTTAVAAAPLILKMLGSEIDFFNSDKQTKYAPYQETLKKYSTEVNITQEQDGMSFTVDNIAVDDNFINIFYTIKSEYNLYESIQQWCINFYKKNDASMWYMNPNMRDVTIDLSIPALDYKISGVDTELDERFGNFGNFDSRDFYVVSDFEIKVAQKMLISEELPEVFTIDIFLSNINNGYIAENLKFINIPLTIDRTATAIKTANIYPSINRIFTGSSRGDNIIFHNVTIKKISMSPLGNVIVFEENMGNKIISSPMDRLLFNDYILIDDKGNYLERNYIWRDMRFFGNTDIIRFSDEIYGIDENTEYIKLIPFTRATSLSWTDGVTKTETGEYYSDIWNAYADKYNLPQKLRCSNKTVLNIELIEITYNTITTVYSVEGIAGYTENFYIAPVYYDNDMNYNYSGTILQNKLYDAETGKHTLILTYPDSTVDMRESVKGIKTSYDEINLLEDESIIIPLK